MDPADRRSVVCSPQSPLYISTGSNKKLPNYEALFSPSIVGYRGPIQLSYLYQGAIRLAMGLSAKKEVFDQFIEKSRAIDPTFFHNEQTRAYTLLPRWMGEKGDWEPFANEVADVPGGLGDEAYAKVDDHEKLLISGDGPTRAIGKQFGCPDKN